MPVAFVSALFLHPGGGFRSIDKYKGYFRQLAEVGVPIYLYLDTHLREYGEELEREFQNVKVMEYLEVDKSFLPMHGILLPMNRHPEKDTVDYMCIQLMKLQVMMRASKATETRWASHLAWIDFGIFHMFKEPGPCEVMLREIAKRNWPNDTILSPSCWPEGSYSIWSSICWRHCGSFLLGARDLFPAAYERQQFLVTCNLPGLTWEVNYWNEMPQIFTTYKADHNDSILTGLLSRTYT